MLQIKKSKRKTIIIGCIIIVICMIGFYFAGRVIKSIFFEEDTAKSSYDEVFVDENDSIALDSSDFTDLQSEILVDISKWKEVSSLSYINVYLDRDLKISSVVFVYQLEDVDNYRGRLEIKCANEDENWKIVRAESVYAYDESEHLANSNMQLKDSLLSKKIQAVVEYIDSKEKPKMDLYLIQINDNSIHIDAHNQENEESQNNWREDCSVYQEGNDVFIESDN